MLSYTPDDFVFGPDSLAWKINRHRTGLLYGPAAALLQVAHPRVAQGVRDWSQFSTNALGRLHGTLRAVNAITFGTHEEAAEMERYVAARHREVQGKTDPDVPGARRYSAFEPELMLWVLGTLIEASLLGYEAVFQEEISAGDREVFYEDFRLFGRAFGLDPDYGPGSYSEWDREYQAEKAKLISHPVCTTVASHVVYPRHRAHELLLGRVFDFVAIEGLDSHTRRQLGLRSTWHSRLRWRATLATLRIAFPRLPAKISHHPESYLAYQRLGLL